MRGPLISVPDLAERLEGPDSTPTILDVRWQLTTGSEEAAYGEGHIPGAVFIDLDRQLADPASKRGRHPLPSPERFAAEMRSLGVSIERPVVVYDAATSMAAARAWWLLRYFGHRDVLVLDGGLAAWIGEGRPLSTETPHVQEGDFLARAGGMPVVDADGIPRLTGIGALVDARAPERFRGEVDPVDPVAGHIPGARNRPTSENLDPRGRFLAPASLRSAFERLGISEDAPIAAYCGSGITAAHEVLALELAGFRASLYPGSWSEWSSDPDRPVSRGD